MGANKTNIFLLMLTITSMATALFFLLQSQKFKDQVGDDAILVDQIPISMELQANLENWDRMLALGNYRQVLSQTIEYKEKNELQDPTAVDSRIAIAKRMASLDESTDTEVIEKTTVDTVEKVVMQTVLPDNNASDSLSFALEKAEMQLKILKEQVKQNSAGAYLTFKTTKGNALHYVGEIKDGKANGYGIAILDSGSRYEGEWKDNMRHGNGTFYWMDGERYEGEYLNDQRSGTGIYYWTNGEKYVGDWSADMRNGSGKFYDSKGDVKASGEWKDDKLDKVDKNM